MIEIKENGCVSARDLHKVLEIKKRYSVWFETACRKADIQPKKELYTFRYGADNSRMEDYLFTTKEVFVILMISNGLKSSNIRAFIIQNIDKKIINESIKQLNLPLAKKIENDLNWYFYQIELTENGQPTGIKKIGITNNYKTRFATHLAEVKKMNKNLDIRLLNLEKNKREVLFIKEKMVKDNIKTHNLKISIGVLSWETESYIGDIQFPKYDKILGYQFEKMIENQTMLLPRKPPTPHKVFIEIKNDKYHAYTSTKKSLGYFESISEILKQNTNHH